MIIGFRTNSQHIPEGDRGKKPLSLEIISLRPSEIDYTVGVCISERNINEQDPLIAITDDTSSANQRTDAIFGKLEPVAVGTPNLISKGDLPSNTQEITGMVVLLVSDARPEMDESFTLSIYHILNEDCKNNISIPKFQSDASLGFYPEHRIIIEDDDG